MKKTLQLVLLVLASILLSACSEKKQYEDAVLAEMNTEQDVQDYKLDPAQMAACVIDMTTRKMPGMFPADPDRMKAYQAYTKLITLKKAKDPQKIMAELRDDFGSAQGLLEARNNYAQSLVECQTTLITNTEAAALAKEEDLATSEPVKTDSTPATAAEAPDSAPAAPVPSAAETPAK